MCGTSSNATLRMITRSWSTWLCLRLWSKADGMASAEAERKTEVPRTRWTEPAADRMKTFFAEGPGLPRAQEWALEAGRSESPDEVLLIIRLPVGERDGVRIRDLVAELEQAVPGIRVTRLHRKKATIIIPDQEAA